MSLPTRSGGSRRISALLEITAFTLLILSYMWGWDDSFDKASTLVVALYFGIGVIGHVRRRETTAELGLRFDNWQRAARNAGVVIGVAALVLLSIGLLLDSWRFPAPSRWLEILPWLLLWGTVQQYGLNCVLYRRFRELSDRHAVAATGAAVLFAVFHLPNPLLTMLTLVAGFVSCELYRREPNVLVLGIAHAAISILIYYSLPWEMTRGMRVGPGYLAD